MGWNSLLCHLVIGGTIIFVKRYERIHKASKIKTFIKNEEDIEVLLSLSKNIDEQIHRIQAKFGESRQQFRQNEIKERESQLHELFSSLSYESSTEVEYTCDGEWWEIGKLTSTHDDGITVSKTGAYNKYTKQYISIISRPSFVTFANIRRLKLGGVYVFPQGHEDEEIQPIEIVIT